MALEQERKFLVNNFVEHQNLEGQQIIQMYIVDKKDHSLRIRIINKKEATICYKYYINVESKTEFEYPFSLSIAMEIFIRGQYDSILIKTRYKKDGWDIDKYSDGLIIAEYEFSNENPLPEYLPYWIGKEVTGEYKYTNPGIAKRNK